MTDGRKKKALAAGIGVVGGIIAIALLRRKGAPDPYQPPLPDGEDTGRVQGYIVDAQTGAKIPDAAIYVDDVWQLNSWVDGTYRTAYMVYGTHLIRVEANDYQIAGFTVEVDQALMNLDLALEPLPQALTDWTEGVQVLSITARPQTSYVGEDVDIGVYIQGPLDTYPMDIHGEVMVNGELLSGDFTIELRNPVLQFHYTSTSPGTFTARAQDKSDTFRVLADIPATYYSPFGGIRMPVCTELTFPDVARFHGHPGGDYVMSGWGAWVIPRGLREVRHQISEAYPTAWSPDSATVRSGTAHVLKPGTSGVVAIPGDYDCPEYWDSKDELARMIARRDGLLAPVERYENVRETYGEPCQRCDGTGRLPCSEVGWPGTLCPCPDCGADGVRVFLNPVRGVRDYQRRPHYSTVGSQGRYAVTLDCPRCSLVLQGPMREIGHGGDALSLARGLMAHIENDHPAYPLTERAWYE